MVVPALLVLLARSVDISILVGWAFAIAASTFCPMFLLGVWWTRLSARGAAVGMLVGALRWRSTPPRAWGYGWPRTISTPRRRPHRS
jgi:Na+/proline symporter